MLMIPRVNAQHRTATSGRVTDQRRLMRSFFALIASLAALLNLAACGGGGGSGSGLPFDLSVVIAGQVVGGTLIGPGVPQNLYISAGQSLELDASEPVVWSLEIGGVVVQNNNVTVRYAGASITQTALSSSRIALDTAADFPPLAAPILITLTATSTIDLAQVATVNVLIAN